MVITNMYHQMLLKLFTVLACIQNLGQVLNSKMNAKEVQRNAVVWWVIVLVVVLILAAFVAACKLAGGEFTGEFKFFGTYFKVQCKN